MAAQNQNEEPISGFFRKLEGLNIKLWLDGEKLRCKAPKGAMTKDILQTIEKRKKNIITFLQAKNDEELFFKPIPKVADSDYYPLSAAQKRMFILNQIDRQSIAYNLTQILKIVGAFDKERFLNVFKQIAQRHECLRTSFEIIDGEPVQIIHSDIDINAEYVEMEGTEADIDGIITKFIRPYDLTSCPLFRLKIVKMSSAANGSQDTPVFYAIVDMHHIISDGVSVAILVKEINALYAGKTIPAPKRNYRDYAAWNEKLMQSGIIKKQREYWIKQLEGEIPVLNLPSDYQRPEKFSFKGDSFKIPIDSNLTQKLKNLAHENSVTLFSVLLSAYYILLLKYTGQKDIIIGTSTAGRRHADINDIFGVFINTVALRNYPDSEKTFTGFLREVGENSLSAFDNQDYPFEKLVDDLGVKRDPSRNPVFDAMFVMLNMDIGAVKAEGTKISTYDYKKKIAQFDILVNAYENKEYIDFEFEYCTSLFKRETIESFGSHFINILKSIVGNSNVKLGCIDILSPDEKAQILYQHNNTQMDYPKNLMIHQLIGEQAEKNPDATALIFKDKQMTYGELNRKADALARTLIKKGVHKDSIVGLMVERSFNMIIGMLGVLKAGGAYLPIDPEFPADRVSYMLEDSGTCILLSQKKIYERLKKGENAGSCHAFEFIDMEDENTFEYTGGSPAVADDPHSLAYVIYTSGSTGKPKGVMLEHKSVVNFIKGVTNRINCDTGNTILCLTTISFDIFVLETLLPLSVGMKIVIADENQQRDSKLLNDVIDNNGVNMLQITPSRLQLLLHGANSLSCLDKLTTIMVGGEAFPQNLLTEVKKLTRARIYNMYGPTETTVWSTVGELSNATSIDIGSPLANQQVYILDKDNNPVPNGIPGELCIAGDGLARGYLHKPELTAEKFIPDPFRKGGRMYKTGDLAKWQSNGKLECLGRIDQQVKIRGFRIELEEIEKRLSDFKGIKECVVVAKADETGSKYLAAYYSAAEELPVSDIRNHLSKDLPDYMVPEIYVFLKKLPYTPNGKIDRKALPEPGNSRPKLETEYKCAVSDSEKILSQIWQNVLNRELVGVDDNFFELGGNSLNLIKMHGEIEKAFPGKVSVTDIFAHPTISKLAQMIDGQQKNTEDDNVKNISEDTDDSTSKETDISKNKDIAIIGMAGKFGSANNVREFWKSIRSGKDFVRKVPEQRKIDSDVYEDVLLKTGMRKRNAEYFDAAFLDRIDCFDCNMFNIVPSEADMIDPNQRLFLETAWEAIEDSGYGGKKLTGSNTGVFVGHSSDFGTDYRNYGQTVYISNEAVAVPGNIKSIIGSRLSYILDLKGPCITIDTACSSALVAIHEACRYLRSGECDMALAGACKINIIPEKVNEDSEKLGTESSSGRSNTFDESADGMGYGEGVGAVLLKPLSKAVEDGDNIYAVIRGSAVNQDGASLGITAPNMAAQEQVILKAWKDAGIDPRTITYIEAHGTGTKLGDPIEIAGITKAFEHYTHKKQFCAVASVKSNIGHLDNAAGIASIIKAVLCLKNRELPPSIHFKNPNRKIPFENSPVFVNDKLCEWESNGPRRCGISSFGMSGTNCHMILEEYNDGKTDTEEAATDSGRLNVFTLSAKNETSLKDLIERYNEYLSLNNNDNLSDICYTANTGRGHYNYRLALIVSGINDLKNKIMMLKGKDLNSIGVEGIFFRKSKIVSSAKQMRQAGELTLDEKRMFSRNADLLLDSILTEKDKVKVSAFAEKLCEAYVKGADVNWEKLYSTGKHYRLSLPSYPFLQERHWIKHNRVFERAADSAKVEEAAFSQAAAAQAVVKKPAIKHIVLKGRSSGVYSETETLLGNVWGEALGFDEINIYDDFFDIGGNSIIAIKVEAYAEKNNLVFTSKDIYEYKTIEQLALFLEKGKADSAVDNEKHDDKKDISSATVNSNESLQLIENIEPFNDVFYRSCFYNSFFPIVNHFGKSILPYLANDVAVYSKKPENGGFNFDVDYISSQPINKVIEEEGLSVRIKGFSDDILKNIKKSVAQKNPVIVWVDCFYESIRNDLFQKEHWAHTILIYGFDDKKKVFHVIEHHYRDNLSYEKRIISYADMFNMCRGYAEKYQQIGQPSMSTFSLRKGCDDSDKHEQRYLQFFKQNVLDVKDLINDGLDCLRLFISDFEKKSLDEAAFFANGNNFISVLNSIMNAKEADRYKINHLLGQRYMSVNNSLDEIIGKWADIRKVTAKLVYANVYNAKKIQNVSHDLEAVYQMERKYHELLITSLKSMG